MTEYTARERRQITRHALHRLAMASEAEASAETRDIARAELQRLYRQDDKPDLREPYVARFTVQPGVHLTVDASHNIILEVRTPDEAELLAAYPLTDVARLATRAGTPGESCDRGRAGRRGGPRGRVGLDRAAGSGGRQCQPAAQ